MSVSIQTSTLRWLVPLAVIIVIALIMMSAVTYSLDETEQAVIVQFGKPVGDSVVDSGLHFKKPFVQEVRRFEKRILAWDGAPDEITTRDREFIFVDSTARWRIINPLLFLKSVRDERGAQSRLDDIIDSVVRDTISSTELVELVRSKDWKIDKAAIESSGISEKEMQLLQREIKVGRQELERKILAKAQEAIKGRYGIELVDVRLKRVNYVPSVRREVFNRMISERQRVAEEFRAKGEGRRADIRGQTQKENAQIQSEAQRQAEIIRGRADAEATRIYNEAYSLDPEFFAFYRTLESYAQTIGKESTLIIASDSDYFHYLRRMNPDQ